MQPAVREFRVLPEPMGHSIVPMGRMVLAEVLEAKERRLAVESAVKARTFARGGRVVWAVLAARGAMEPGALEPRAGLVVTPIMTCQWGTTWVWVAVEATVEMVAMGSVATVAEEVRAALHLGRWGSVVKVGRGLVGPLVPAEPVDMVLAVVARRDGWATGD